MLFPSPLQNSLNNQLGRGNVIDPKARKFFDRALRAGKNNRRHRALPNVNDETHSAQHYLGVKTIDINEIGGSVNKSNDFDADFNPMSAHIEPRWTKVASAMLNGIDLPPVELILVNGTYYVIDGHHRVSVAHAIGIRYLDAIVVKWE